MKLKQQTTDQPRSFDAATTQQIIGMAARLKAERSEQLSQAQVEAIAAEVGIEPEYVHRSLSYVADEQNLSQDASTTKRHDLGRKLGVLAKVITAVGWIIPFLPLFARDTGALIYVRPGWLPITGSTLFVIYSCLLLGNYLFVSVGLRRLSQALLAGQENGWEGALARAWKASGWTLMPAAFLYFSGDIRYMFLWAFAMLAVYIGGNHYLSRFLPRQKTQASPTSPPSAETGVSRDALLAQLFSLQQQLEGTRTPLSFLSLDVVGSSGIKKASSELAVEYTFSAYRRFLVGIVQAEGGELQVAAGDGAMCVFRDEAAALRAGQRILTELSQFNAAHNKLTEPLRIRAGVNSGPVAWEPGVPIGFLQSVVIDDAARIQKEAEPNSLALHDPYNAEQVITWKPS